MLSPARRLVSHEDFLPTFHGLHPSKSILLFFRDVVLLLEQVTLDLRLLQELKVSFCSKRFISECIL